MDLNLFLGHQIGFRTLFRGPNAQKLIAGGNLRGRYLLITPRRFTPTFGYTTCIPPHDATTVPHTLFWGDIHRDPPGRRPARPPQLYDVQPDHPPQTQHSDSMDVHNPPRPPTRGVFAGRHQETTLDERREARTPTRCECVSLVNRRSDRLAQ